MTILEAIDCRHSVRAYKDDPIPPEIREQLDHFANECNEQSGLNIKIIYDDPEGFDSRLAHYGSFKNVRNYIVLKGVKSSDFDYLCGYYGEKLVLYSQQLGLNTCWAALTFNKKKVQQLVPQGETLCMVISLGYGVSQGHPHKGKTPADVTQDSVSLWFDDGIAAALKAPTAMNQQKFAFYEKDGEAWIKVKGLGPFTKVDFGIAAYHFEVATGKTIRH